MSDSNPQPKTKNPLAASLLQMAGQTNVITVRRPFVNFTGTLERAMLLDQLLYWTSRSVMNGWIAKSDVELQEELCLTRYSVRTAREGLVEMKIIEVDVRKFNGFPTQHYRVDMAELTHQWSEFVSRLSEIEQTDYSKSDKRLSEIEQSLTEPTYREYLLSLSARDFEKMTVPQAKEIATLKMYEDSTGFFPGSLVWFRVHSDILKFNLTAERLKTAAEAWSMRGHRKENIEGILEWARDGVPANQKGKAIRPSKTAQSTNAKSNIIDGVLNNG